MATDNIPAGPKATPRKKRGIFSTDAATPQPATQRAPEPADATTSQAATPSRKSPAKKGWDRSGQVSVVLGEDRHARLKGVWASNAHKYGSVADLIREAIDDKLDRLN